MPRKTTKRRKTGAAARKNAGMRKGQSFIQQVSQIKEGKEKKVNGKIYTRSHGKIMRV